jgi:hypothetical protein
MKLSISDLAVSKSYVLHMMLYYVLHTFSEVIFQSYEINIFNVWGLRFHHFRPSERWDNQNKTILSWKTILSNLHEFC